MKVSICIPTYNQACYLEQAIRSAAQQTLPATEIIVANDCSTDNTAEVLRKLSAEIPVLKVVNQPENTGIAYNTNTCLRLATGDFVIRLDSDDYLAPDYAKKLTELLQQYPEAGYAHAGVQEVNEKGKVIRTRKLARMSGFQTAPDALRAARKGYRVAANIITFRAAALRKVGFVSQTDYVEDFHLAASLAAAGFGNVYQNETLSFYRVWTDAGKTRQRRKLAEITGLRKVFEEVIEPAYVERGWDVRELRDSRATFACEHADCLGWRIYNAAEKKQLSAEIEKLSSSRKTKLLIWLYSNDFGGIMGFAKKSKRKLRSVVKTLYLRFNL